VNVQIFPAVIGAYRKVKLTLPIGTYTGAETLAASVWPGDDQPELFAPTVAWLVAADRTMTLEWDGTLTEDLAPGRYLVELRITSGGNTVKLRAGIVELMSTPGVGVTLSAYCTADDMRKIAPWIDEIQAQSDQAGFAEQRAMARDDFDRLVQTHYGGADFDREDSLDQFLSSGGYGWDAGEDDATLQELLDDDRLVLTGPTGKVVVRWNAYTAVAHVCQSQIGANPDSPYASRARYCMAMADELLCSLTVGIDTSTDGKDGAGDGVPDVFVPLGRTRTIRR
jgi:hypothetical protein